jgi:hypothetical protein
MESIRENRSQSPEVSNSYSLGAAEQQDPSLPGSEEGATSPPLPLETLTPVSNSPEPQPQDSSSSVSHDPNGTMDGTREAGVPQALVATTPSSESELSSVVDDWDEE